MTKTESHQIEAHKIAAFHKTEEIHEAIFTEILCFHLSITTFSIFIVSRTILLPSSPPRIFLSFFYFLSLANRVISPHPMC